MFKTETNDLLLAVEAKGTKSGPVFSILGSGISFIFIDYLISYFFITSKKDKNLLCFIFSSFTLFPLRCSSGNFNWSDNCSIYTLPFVQGKSYKHY